MPGFIYQCGATRYRESVVDTFCGLSLRRTLTDIKNMLLGLARTRIHPDRRKCKYAFYPPSTCPRHFQQAESSYSCSSRMFFTSYCRVVLHCSTANCQMKDDVGLSGLQAKVRNQQHSPEAFWETGNTANTLGVAEE